MNIFAKFVKAVKEFELIKDGDRVAVGLSGGKDSLTLVDLLGRLKKTDIVDFEYTVILVDMFDGKYDFSALREFCEERGADLHVVRTQIYEILFDVRKEKNPCSLCSKLRKGQLVSEAKRLGFEKIALGHHGDDFVETFFMSLAFEGRLSTFEPLSYLDRQGVYQIRPLIYVREREIVEYSKDFPIFANPCPADKHTKRQEVKDALRGFEKINPRFVDNTLTALLDKTKHQNFFAPFGGAKKLK